MPSPVPRSLYGLRGPGGFMSSVPHAGWISLLQGCRYLRQQNVKQLLWSGFDQGWTRLKELALGEAVQGRGRAKPPVR